MLVGRRRWWWFDDYDWNGDYGDYGWRKRWWISVRRWRRNGRESDGCCWYCCEWCFYDYQDYFVVRKRRRIPSWA